MDSAARNIALPIRSSSNRHERPVAFLDFDDVGSGGTSNRDWWPNQLKLELLHQHSSKSNPMGEDFNYAKSSRASTWRR
jgi:catalase-peroxidase